MLDEEELDEEEEEVLDEEEELDEVAYLRRHSFFFACPRT